MRRIRNRRRLAALSLALLAPVLLMASSSATAAGQPGIARSTPDCIRSQPPPTPHPLPTPTYTSFPTPRPDLASPPPTPAHLPTVPGDDLRLAAPRAYGVLTGPYAGDDAQYPCYVLTAKPSAFPKELPVWNMSPAGPDPASVIALFHAGPPIDPLRDLHGDRFTDAGEPFVQGGSIGWQGGMRIGPPPQNDADALAIVDRFFRGGALVPQSWTPSVFSFGYSFTGIYDEVMKGWCIQYRRVSLDGIPIQAPRDVPHNGGVGGMVSLRGDGAITAFELAYGTIAGGSLYGLRNWQAAWDDVAHGHWTSAAGNYHDSLSGYAFIADRVSLVYAPLSSFGQPSPNRLNDRHVLVPMYEFTDSAKGVTLQVTALTDDEERSPN
jgi:hypothetical protein